MVLDQKSEVQRRWLNSFARALLLTGGVASCLSVMVVGAVLMFQNGTRISIQDGTMQSCYVNNPVR